MADTKNLPVDLEDIRTKLYERLKPSGWAAVLKTFLLSDDFLKILQQLLKEREEGKRFTPLIKQVFRAFEECPYSELKVIMLGQDPYPQPGVADGIAFSCSNTGKPEASMRYVFQALSETVYPFGYYGDTDLARWSRQGILMINTALTTRVGIVGQHYSLWQPFLAFLFDVLGWNNPGLIYVFMGQKAQGWMKSIPDNNHKLVISHPASAAHNRAERWECDDVFNRINKILHDVNGFKIEW